MADKENKNSFEESTFDKRFKEIVGIAYPPEKEEQWCVVLQYAGYSMTEIHSILSTLGYPGYKEAGELPDAWVSKYNNATKYQQLTFDQSPCGEIPQFSPDLLRRLESAFAEKGPLSWSGEPRDTDETSQPTNKVEETPVQSDVKHSTDFRSMLWFGTDYSFTEKQTSVVRLLLENWEAGTPDVGDETLLQEVDHEAPPARLAVLFRGHDAWGTMIVPGGTKGTHRLSSPKAK